MGGLVGASQGVEDLIEKAGRQIGDAIAEKRGVAKKTETVSRPLEPQIGAPPQDTRAGKCHGQRLATPSPAWAKVMRRRASRVRWFSRRQSWRTNMIENGLRVEKVGCH